MTFDEYVDLAKRTQCNYEIVRERIYSPGNTTHYGSSERVEKPVKFIHGAIGIVKEGGELLSEIEASLYYGGLRDETKIEEELGDVMWYVALVCDTFGFSLEDVCKGNIDKLRRRYPDKFEEKRADRRNRENESKNQVLEQILREHGHIAHDEDKPPAPLPPQRSCEHVWEETLAVRTQNSWGTEGDNAHALTPIATCRVRVCKKCLAQESIDDKDICDHDFILMQCIIGSARHCRKCGLKEAR